MKASSHLICPRGSMRVVGFSLQLIGGQVRDSGK
jgi:hypothetical protein